MQQGMPRARVQSHSCTPFALAIAVALVPGGYPCLGFDVYAPEGASLLRFRCVGCVPAESDASRRQPPPAPPLPRGVCVNAPLRRWAWEKHNSSHTTLLCFPSFFTSYFNPFLCTPCHAERCKARMDRNLRTL